MISTVKLRSESRVSTYAPTCIVATTLSGKRPSDAVEEGTDESEVELVEKESHKAPEKQGMS